MYLYVTAISYRLRLTEVSYRQRGLGIVESPFGYVIHSCNALYNTTVPSQEKRPR